MPISVCLGSLLSLRRFGLKKISFIWLKIIKEKSSIKKKDNIVYKIIFVIENETFNKVNEDS